MKEQPTIGPSELMSMLHADATHYDTLARSYLSKIDQLLTVAVGVIAILVPVLFGTKQYVVGLFVTLAANFLLLFAANATGEMFALSAHRFRVEQRLAALLARSQTHSAEPVVFTPWEDTGGQVRRHSLCIRSFKLAAYLPSWLRSPASPSSCGSSYLTSDGRSFCQPA
jgi:hypothetical protein